MIKEFTETPEQVAKREAFEKESLEMESFISDFKSGKINESTQDEGVDGDPSAEESQSDVTAQEPDAKSVTQEAKKQDKQELKLEETKPDAKQETKPEERKPSKYEKAAQRASAEWQRINAEKAEIAKVKAEVDQWKKEREQARLEEQKRLDEEDAKKPSPEQYEALAKQKENEGDTETAALAREMAKERREEIAKRQAIKTQPGKFWSDSDFTKKQAEQFDRAAKEHPEIRLPSSPLSLAVSSMMKDDPGVKELIETVPSGIYYATKHAAVAASAARVPELEKQVKDLQTQLRELQVRTTPVSGDHVAEQIQEKPWWEKSTREMEAELDKAYG